jgi:hypothetical protein
LEAGATSAGFLKNENAQIPKKRVLKETIKCVIVH